MEPSEDTGPAPAAPAALVLELDLTLRVPVTLGKETTTVLHLSEPTLDQVRKMQRGATPGDQLAILIEQNARVLPAVVAELRARDYREAEDFFARFWPA